MIIRQQPRQFNTILLPPDVLEYIQNKLPIRDQANFAVVNKAWAMAGSRPRGRSRWEFNFARHFPHQYHLLVATKTRIVNWRAEFENQSNEEYKALTPWQRKLFRLVKDSDLATLRKLVLKINPDDLIAKDSNGFSITFWANYYGSYAWLDEIFQLKILPIYSLNGVVNANQVAMNNRTILHMAIKFHQKPEFVHTVLAANPHIINVQDEFGATPLLIACKYRASEIVALLLNQHANFDLPDKIWCHPLFISSQQGDVSSVKLLIAHGADVNVINNKGLSPLFIAGVNGHPDVVELLINAGARLESTWMNKDCMFLVACQKGFTAMVRLLLERFPTIDLKTKYPEGNTVLHIACEHGHKDTVELLLDSGADINLLNNAGKSPLAIASEKQHSAVMNILLKRGAQVDLRKPAGATPLFFVCSKGYESSAKQLLAAGANVNVKCETHLTPLMIASQNGHKNVVRLLLAAGAKVNSRNTPGATSLFIACFNGHVEVVKLLIAHGANLNAKNKMGTNPISVAFERGNINLVILLLEAGADVNLTLDECASVLKIASIENRNDTVVKLVITMLQIYINVCQETIASLPPNLLAKPLGKKILGLFPVKLDVCEIQKLALTLLHVLKGEESPTMFTENIKLFNRDWLLKKLSNYCVTHHLVPAINRRNYQ